jgi:hypothetical protein
MQEDIFHYFYNRTEVLCWFILIDIILWWLYCEIVLENQACSHFELSDVVIWTTCIY